MVILFHKLKGVFSMADFLQLRKLFNTTQYLGYSEKLIQCAINQYGSLPKVLLDYCIQCGGYETLNNAQNHFLEVAEWNIIGSKQDYLWFYGENQDVCRWAISMNDLNKDNPPVYVTYDEETFLKETDTLYEFLIAMGYFNASLGLEYSTEDIYFINLEQYNKIVNHYKKLLNLHSNWVDMEFYQNHSDDIIYMSKHDNDEYELLYSSNNEEHFNELDEFMQTLNLE